MVSFTVRVDENARTILEVDTFYGKFIDGPEGEGPVKYCEQGTEFEARIAERMLIGAMQAVAVKTKMVIQRTGGRLDLSNSQGEKFSR
jgi:hypothetical protein